MKNSFRQSFKSNAFGFFILIAAFVAVGFGFYQSHKNSKNLSQISMSSSATETRMDDFYMDSIQPIFDNKCAACHSCLNSPCQFNLTSYEGFERGAHKFVNPYDWALTGESPLTRLGVDAHSEKEWRKKGFFSMHKNSDVADKTIFMQMLTMKMAQADKDELPRVPVEDSRFCPITLEEQQQFAEQFPASGMPYGLPELTNKEYKTLRNWIKDGAPGPASSVRKSLKTPNPVSAQQIKVWQEYLNEPSDKQRLISRYLYEHLFLAHIHFDSAGREFFRLVRSKTSCDSGLQVISSRRPTDDPKVSDFYYCFDKVDQLVVDKTHIPYLLSEVKLNRLKFLFNQNDWNVKGGLPNYNPETSLNPFETFRDIPAKARYQFLLDDANYHINTFIKGPVCFGHVALNSISDQFYVLFLKPESDASIIDPDYERAIAKNLYLPGAWGSQVNFLKQIGGIKPSVIFADRNDLVEKMEYNRIIREDRNNYRAQRAAKLKSFKPKGYTINDIWDGDGFNSNAVLTVMRHYDSSTVVRGAMGDTSKTVFMLDYPLFERLVYNLTVGYDVFSGVGHQVLSRLYMDYIRMEGEENYLLFLPANLREQIRNSWYEDRKAQKKLGVHYPQLGLDLPTSVVFKDPNRAQSEFMEKVLFGYFKPQVRGSIDTLNWKSIAAPKKVLDAANSNVRPEDLAIYDSLRQVTSLAANQLPFARYIPDVTFIRVKQSEFGSDKDLAFSMIQHKDYRNLSFVFQESKRRRPEKDSFSVFPGFVGSYPNYFLVVEAQEINQFVDGIKKVQSKKDFRKFLERWGVSRTNQEIWEHYNWFNQKARSLNSIDSGHFDLTRYDQFN